MEEKQLPVGWVKDRLGKHIQEVSKRNADESDIPVLSVTNSHGFVLSEDYFERQVYSKKLDNYKIVQKGQFAYNPSRLNVGSLARLTEPEKGLLSPMYVVFDVNGQIDSNFLEYWLKSEYTKALIKVSTQGTVRDTVNYATLAGFTILRPPLSQQEKIADILSSVDATIETTRQVIDQTRQVKQTLMHQLLTRGIPGRHSLSKHVKGIGEVPNEWDVANIKDLGQVQAGRQRSPHFKEGISRPYLRVANVYDGYIDISDVLEMPFTEKEYETYKLIPGDILLNEGQSLELVGRSAVYNGIPSNCCFQNTLIRFRAGKQILPTYAHKLFQFLQYNGSFSKIALQTTSIAHLGVGRFASLRVVVPPRGEQEEIVDIIQSLEQRLRFEEIKLAGIEGLKSALMQGLLTGRIPVEATEVLKVAV